MADCEVYPCLNLGKNFQESPKLFEPEQDNACVRDVQTRDEKTTFFIPVLIVANQFTFAQSNWVRKDFLCKNQMLRRWRKSLFLQV